MENIALEVFDLEGNGSQFANLPPNTSITVTETSEIFDSGDIWSHSFVLNVFANASIFGTTGDIHGGRLHEQIDSRRARLWVLGLPMYFGYLKLDDEVDVEENGDVSVSFESGRKTFLQMVDGVKANQVPIPDDILIGMAVDRERTASFRKATISIKNSYIDLVNDGEPLPYECEIKGIENFSQMFPKFVQPYGDWKNDSGGGSLSISRNTTVNTDYPFDDGHPYCNTRICYQKKEWKNNNGTIEKQSTRDYKICPGGRVNPSPNFYVLYWLKMLMSHLDIHIEENQMLGVEDMKRLFFVNTKCAYKTKGDGSYTSIDETNGYDKYMPFGPANPFVPIPTTDNPSWKLKGTRVGGGGAVSRGGSQESIEIVQISEAFPSLDPVVKWQRAYATSDNFPNVDIKDVIEAIEAGFGIRMLFSSDYTRVRIVLLRNIFRSSQRQTMPGTTIEEYKTENRIRGFRLTYGGSEDDTEFVYKGFELAKKKADGGWVTEEDTHDYSQFDETKHYEQIKDEVRMLNNTCYIDDATGNAYIIKVDKDAKNSADQYNPSVFGCAEFMDAEDGDCTGDEETIKEIRIGFSPMIANAIKDGTYALYVAEEMGVSLEPIDTNARGASLAKIKSLDLLTKDWNKYLSSSKETVEAKTGLFEIATATTVELYGRNSDEKRFIVPGGRNGDYQITISGWLREGYRLYLEDNYDPNDEMECPLEKHDWGLMFGIMRGTNAGSVDATVTYENDIDDGEGNCTWEITPGAIAVAHSDTCDDNGNPWDYRPRVAASGKGYGDYVISDAGGIPVNMRGNTKDSRKGPVRSTIYEPYQGSGYSLYDLYAGELFSITEQGYFACDDSVTCKDGKTYAIWINCVDSSNTLLPPAYIFPYIEYLKYGHVLEIGEIGDPNDYPENLSALLGRDAMGCSITAYFVTKTLQNMIVFATQKAVSYTVLQDACEAYNHWSDMDYTIPSGEEVEQTGLISLKLRAEKPNPYYDPGSDDPEKRKRYLDITTPALRHRGLADQFHAEESYWWRNARIIHKKRRMGIADIMNIDKTVQQKVDGVTGFVKKLQYSVDIQTGLSPVEMEIMYL